MDVLKCLQKINPNVGWSVNANDYNQITCHNNSVVIPSLQQLESAWIEVQKEQTLKSFISIVQSHLDSEAAKLNYGDEKTSPIASARSYAGYQNQFQAECIIIGQWCANVWTKCYEIMAEVEAGTRSVPTEEQLLAELPVLVLS